MKRYYQTALSNAAKAGAFAGMALALSSAVQAADVSAYAVKKGRGYVQSSATAPQPAPGTAFIFVASAEGDVAAITEATLDTPAAFGKGLPLSPSDDGMSLEFALSADSAAQVDMLAPSGQYTFTFDTENDGTTIAMLNLTGTTFPPAPQVSNFAAAQTINPSADFALGFNSFTGNGGDDAFEFSLSTEGTVILSERSTGSSVTIPAGLLDPNTQYDATLTFIDETQRDSSTYPGAVGIASLFATTKFTLRTSAGGGGGGGNDTTAPTLFAVQPQSGATNVPVSGTIMFIFSEPMANTHAIEWSANVNTSALAYSWLPGGQAFSATSRGAFPPNATVTWKLNPTAGAAGGFRDVAGNALATGTAQGSFTTGAAGSVDPCDENPADNGRGYGMVFKGLQYVQTGDTTPVLDPENAANFFAQYRGASNQTVTAVTVSGPNGSMNLESFFGAFMTNSQFATPAALETAFPAGNYTFTATGAGSSSVAVGNTTTVPVPRVGNLTALVAMDVTKDFTLTFAPFTGAGATDSIMIQIIEDGGQGRFTAPDPCVPRDLPNTATSVVIPANTFKVGQRYSGSITFSRMSFNTNAIPGTDLAGGVSVVTSFDFTAPGGGGQQPRAPMWTTITRNQDGTVTYNLAGDTGLNVAIEATETAGTGWVQLSTATLTGGNYQFTVNPNSPRKRFYRARAL